MFGVEGWRGWDGSGEDDLECVVEGGGVGVGSAFTAGTDDADVVAEDEVDAVGAGGGEDSEGASGFDGVLNSAGRI